MALARVTAVLSVRAALSEPWVSAVSVPNTFAVLLRAIAPLEVETFRAAAFIAPV